MADPIEELLQQIQQGETDRLPLGGTAKQSSSAANSLSSNRSADLSVPIDRPKPIDHLLAEIEGNPAANPIPSSEESLPSRQSPPSPNPHSVDALLSQLDRSGKNTAPTLPIASTKPQPVPSKPNPAKPEPQPPAQPIPPPNPQPRNPQLEKQKRRQAIERRAQEWLKNLDPHGGEAHFFETLAEKYPSRLEAAIDFLGLEQE